MRHEGVTSRRGRSEVGRRVFGVRLRFADVWVGDLPENLGEYIFERKIREVVKRKRSEGLLTGQSINADSLCQIAPPVELLAEIPKGDETKTNTYYVIPDVIVHLEPRGWTFVTDSAWYQLKLSGGEIVTVQTIYVFQGRSGEKELLWVETLASLRAKTGVEEE